MVRAIAEHAYRAGAKFVDLSVFDMYLKRARALYGSAENLGYVPPWMGERVLALGELRAARISLSGPSAPACPRRRRSAVDRTRHDAARRRVDDRRQRPHDQLVDRARARRRRGRCSCTRGWSRRRRSSGCGRRSRTSAGSTSPTRSPPGTSRLERARAGRRDARPSCGSTRSGCRARDRPDRRAAAVQPLDRRRASRPSTGSPTPEPADRGGVHDARSRARRRHRHRDQAAVRIGGRRSPGCASASSAAAWSRSMPSEGAEVLRGLVGRDDGAARLGELALVDGEGRIGPLGTVFYDTLLDENAASHIALGAGLSDGRRRRRRPATGQRLSEIHIDFMIGSEEVSVDRAAPRGGEVVPLLRAHDLADLTRSAGHAKPAPLPRRGAGAAERARLEIA